MDDNLFSSRHHHCQHTKCSCVFPQQAKIGCHAITTTNCKAIDIQLLFDGKKLSKKHPRWGSMEHSLIMVPKNKTIIQGRLVPCKMKNGKWKCTNCSNFVYSYCTCTPVLMFCVDCFANHRVEVATAQSLDTQFGVSSFSQ